MMWVSGVTRDHARGGRCDLPDSIAAHAGLHSGDEILAINGAPVSEHSAMSSSICSMR